jgi:serine/threonine protein kinase
MLKGGKIIADSGKSCILYPSHTSNLNVTKITEKSDAVHEIGSTKYLMPFDKNETYGIYPKNDATCSYDKILKVLEKETEPCEAMESFEGPACMFSIERYDHDLLIIPNESSASILRGLLHLWSCLAFLQKHNSIHCDIKADNIAYRSKFSGEPKMFSLADWGLSKYNLTEASARDRVNFINENKFYIYKKNLKYNEKKPKPYSPFLSTEASKRFSAIDLVYSNDVFSMALLQMEFIKKCVEAHKIILSKKINNLIKCLSYIVDNQEDCVLLRPTYIKKTLEPLYN